MNGEYTKYYENGQIEIKTTFKDGEKNGEYISYYENGQIRNKTTYK
ncbi:MAG: hypothetical protein KAH04_02805, partial [Psychrilyobacter sp.]|nr:hypothetical protein [Psychrilyobacter sp.]